MSLLSEHDLAVLNAVFNPNLPLTDVAEEEIPSCLKDIEEETPEVIKTKQLEIVAIKKAESGDLEGALRLLNSAIDQAPKRPSLYNNRAQVFQLKGKLDDAFYDLSKAIELCNDNFLKTKCQVLCQRGLLHRKADRVELAKDDFNEAAKMGSTFAKSQLVILNPYAAMCNQMLKQVMDKLQ